MTASMESRDTLANDLIDDLLTEFADNWQSAEELKPLADCEIKLSVLRQHFPDHPIESLSRSEVASGLQ